MDPPTGDENSKLSVSGGRSPEAESSQQPLAIPSDMSTAEGKRKKVEFSRDTAPPSPEEPLSPFEHVYPVSPQGNTTPSPSRPSPTLSDSPQHDEPPLVRRNSVSDQELSRQIHHAFGKPYHPKKPAIRKSTFVKPPEPELAEEELHGTVKSRSVVEAQERAKRLAARVGTYSANISRVNSTDTMGDQIAVAGPSSHAPAAETDTDDDSEDDLYLRNVDRSKRTGGDGPVERATTETRNLVSTFGGAQSSGRKRPTPIQAPPYEPRPYQSRSRNPDEEEYLTSGQVTPMTEGGSITEEYVPPPSTYRPGLLADLLTLRGKRERYAYGRSRDSSAEPSLTSTPPRSGASTPTGRGRFFRRRTREGLPYSGSVAQLIGSSSTLALPTLQSAEGFAEQAKRQRPKRPENRKRTSSAFTTALNRMYRGRNEDEVRITVHIAETIARQKYLVKLCQALMMYGAPTHRLEEYLKMSARVLEIEGQFLYIPGCMIIAFDDSSTHTTEVKLVKTTQGVDLGKLRDTHEIYKEVVHDMIGVEEATRRLNAVQRRKRKYPLWFIVFTYGLASAFVGPFAFEARLIDMPISFLLGILLGTLQHVLAPKSDLYANVFEISAAVMSSFLARAMGSIRNSHGEFIFCFSALAQSGITLILPGYAVLCASLELQSKSIIAGSVRMVYALIYSFFLGFGITVGTVVYGLMDHKASSETTCGNKIPTGYYILFVPGFTICLIIINRAKWKQAPIMMVIALSGYVVNFFASRHLHGNTQVINTLSALVIGIEANLYSRLGPRCDNYVSHKWARYVQPWLRPRLRPVRRFARHFARHTRRAVRRAERYVPRTARLPWIKWLKRVPKLLRRRKPLPEDPEEKAREEEAADRRDARLKRRAERRAARGDGYPLRRARVRKERGSDESGSESESEGSSSSSESPERPVRDKVGFGLAAAAMLPAIFVQVPSGLAVGGSLLSGLASADELVNGEGQTTVVSNARDATVMNGTAFNVGYSVIQVAIGITVGLFLSAWIVYPFGKKRSGLFSF